MKNTQLNQLRTGKVRDGVLTYSTNNAHEQRDEILELNSLIKSIENDLEVIIQQKGAKQVWASHFVKKIVERHKGTIVASGISDKGAVVTIELLLKQGR